MTFTELYERVLEILPFAEFSEDIEGQIIINTALRETRDGNLILFDEADEILT